MQNLCYFAVFGTLFGLCLTDAETHNTTLPKPQCDDKEIASTLLDVAKDFMNKAKISYPNCIDDGLHCGGKKKSLAFLDVASNLISDVKNNFPTCPETMGCLTKPMDCSEILKSGKNESGVYTIWPRSRITTNKSVVVYCDMDTDGGGWTVIQRRGKFSTPKDLFYRDWYLYKIGFGDEKEEFWLGNDNIYAISNQAHYAIRLDLKDAQGATGYAEYDTFWIDDEYLNYTLHISGYNGTVGNNMANNNNKQFSTKDRKNDTWKTNSCAVILQGAWWYQDCADVNLNGLYQPGHKHHTSIRWGTWRGDAGLAEVEMKLRPKEDY